MSSVFEDWAERVQPFRTPPTSDFAKELHRAVTDSAAGLMRAVDRGEIPVFEDRADALRALLSSEPEDGAGPWSLWPCALGWFVVRGVGHMYTVADIEAEIQREQREPIR